MDNLTLRRPLCLLRTTRFNSSVRWFALSSKSTKKQLSIIHRDPMQQMPASSVIIIQEFMRLSSSAGLQENRRVWTRPGLWTKGRLAFNKINYFSGTSTIIC